MQGPRAVLMSVMMLALSLPASPAAAQDAAKPGAGKHERGREQGERRGRHRNDADRGQRDDGVGGFLLGALVVGGIAALASRKSRTVIADGGPVLDPPPSTIAIDPDAAVYACAAAAEGEGRRTFALAQMGEVRAVDAIDSGYAVQGDLLLRTTYREPGERRVFRCSVDSQAVRRVTIDGLAMLPR